MATYNEALPMVDDSRLADDMCGFIGQEATHADTHDKIPHEFMEAQGASIPGPSSNMSTTIRQMLAPFDVDRSQAPVQSSDRALADRRTEHYTAVMR